MNVYNSLTRTTENFSPLEAKKIRMYVCGITPYDTTHLGHAFLYVFFDAVYRYLTYKGYEVNYTQNVTDIDDDILKRANKESKDWKELGNFWTDKFLADLKSLNVITPTHYVRATDSIPTIIKITSHLLQKGYAYAKEGNVYFEVKKLKKYGQLSGFTSEQMLHIAQERGGNTTDTHKKDPLDFILWQKSEKDEPHWESPWSHGRPGWHIECSAMVHDYLGETIDIHGGGRDLIFPHHESEIAQSESYTSKSPYVKYWMHASMVMYQGEKMSKSLGNLVMVSDLLKNYSPNAVRWTLLSHHYRNPWEFTESEIKNIAKKVSTIEKRVMTNTYEKDQTIEQKIENDFNFSEALKTLEETKNPATLSHYFHLLGFS